MKKYILMLFMANTALQVCRANVPTPAKQYVINGHIKGIGSGSIKLTFYNPSNRKQKIIDSGTVTNGSFALKGEIDGPKLVNVTIEPGNWNFNLFVETNTVEVNADTTGAIHTDYTKYGGGKFATITKVTEKGSQNFVDWMAYENDPGQKQYEPALDELNKKFDAAGKDIDAQYKVRDEMDSVHNLLHAWQQSKIDAYVSQNPSSVAGVYMFSDLYEWVKGSMPYADLDAIMNKFTGDAKESDYYKGLEVYHAKLKAVQPGEVAPDFTLLRPDSTKLTLSSTRGKYMLIDFWASWCHPCRQAIPHWKEIYAKYKDKGFGILSVSDDNIRKDWLKAMDDEKMPWPQVDDTFPVKRMPAQVASMYMTTFIPFYVLLDKEGKILVYTGDETKIDSKLEELLGK